MTCDKLGLALRRDGEFNRGVMKTKEQLFYEFLAHKDPDAVERIRSAWLEGWNSCKFHYDEILRDVMKTNKSPILRDALISVLKRI